MRRYSVIFFLMAFFVSEHSFAQDTEKQKTIADSLNAFAFKYRQSKRVLSFKASRKAMAISSEIHYGNGENDARLNLAQYYISGNRYDSALYFLQAIDNRQIDPIKQGLTKFYTGRVYSSLRDSKRATVYFNEAGKIFEANTAKLLSQREFNDFIGAVPNSLGAMKMLQQNYNESLQFFFDALQLRGRYNLPQNKELYNIAFVYTRMGNSRRALTFLYKALTIAHNLADTTALLQTTNVIGNCYKDLKRFDSAAIFYDSAVAIGSRLKRRDLSANALVNKAKLMHELERYDESIRLLHETISIAREFRQQGILSHAFEQLGASFYQLKRYDSAVYYNKKAYAISLRTQYKSVLSSSAKSLATLYKDRNQMDSAYKYLEKYHQHDEEIDSLNTASQFSDLRVRLETVEKEQEISILQSQQEVDRLKNQRLGLALVFLSLLAVLVVVGLFMRQKTQKRLNALEQAKLKAELEANRDNLTKQTLGMINVNNCLDEIQEQVKDLITTQSDIRLARVVNLIKANKTSQNDWENFNKYFGSVHGSFYEKLTGLDSQLSTHEKRICALIKLNLTNREIATLLNIEARSVITMKYRIKKKLLLDESTDLESYLLKLS